jgi:hypothetical protein
VAVSRDLDRNHQNPVISALRRLHLSTHRAVQPSAPQNQARRPQDNQGRHQRPSCSFATHNIPEQPHLPQQTRFNQYYILHGAYMQALFWLSRAQPDSRNHRNVAVLTPNRPSLSATRLCRSSLGGPHVRPVNSILLQEIGVWGRIRCVVFYASSLGV